MDSKKQNFKVQNNLNLDNMKVKFNKYTDKNDFLITIIPTIVFGKEYCKCSIGFVWLCFIINIDF